MTTTSGEDKSNARKTSRTTAFLWCVAAYAAGAAAALITGLALSDHHPIIVAAGADLAATIVVFGFSVAFDNSSFYDPYWSVAPVGIVAYWLVLGRLQGVSLLQPILIATLVSAWSIRLTYNWARHWRGIDHEDWRYADYRDKVGRWYWPVSFGGFHLMPTVVVFLGCLPLYPALTSPGMAAQTASPLSAGLTAAAALITALAIWTEARADRELADFVKTKKEPGETLRTGLWAYSRHPNYFGEVLFWWGLYLFGLAADPSYWWTVAGPLSITLLFVFISIPLIDERMLERHPGYAEHKEKVSAIVPWFPAK